MSSGPYLTPSYFPPSYFGPPGVTAPVDPAVPTTSYRDRDAFAALVAALITTGEFADVLFPGPLQAVSVGADRTPLGVVNPEEWREFADASGQLLRHVSYTLTIAVRLEDAGDRFRRIDRLTSVVQNVIEGSTLGGNCLPPLTLLRRGKLDAVVAHPELRLILQGEFTYPVSSRNAHDTTP